MIPKIFNEVIDLGDGRSISIETGKLAKQAHGSVVVQMGNAMLLCTVVSNYEASDSNKIVFVMREQSQSFGSRLAGNPVRTKLQNLYKMSSGSKIYIDFDNIPLISSSFADEVFGKMFVEIGPIGFMQTFEFKRITNTVRKLIDKAIAQRMAAG